MSKHKFEMSVRSYSTVEFEVDLHDEDIEAFQFYLDRADSPTWDKVRDLLCDDTVHKIDVAARKAKAEFKHHEIAGNQSFYFD